MRASHQVTGLSQEQPSFELGPVHIRSVGIQWK